jgi:hypothetical protein
MKRYASRKSVQKRLPVLVALFLLVAIPLAVYGLATLDSFDTRNRAAEEEFTPNTCSISFPYVNPESVPVGDVVHVQVSAYIPNEGITLIRIFNRTGDELLNKSYDGTSDKVTEIFTFTPEQIGKDNITGAVTTVEGAKPCVLEGAASVLAVTTNLAPEFVTQPTGAKPSNAIKVNDNYEYTLQVEDAENDTINYDFSFTPDAEWLHNTVIEDGGDGKLTIKFAGVPDKPASYLANIFVHDGYTAHLRSQSWVISVEQDKNDVPKVTIYEPAKETSVTQGEVVGVAWEGTDLNKITKYELFISANPGNSNRWLPIDTSLSAKVGRYLFDTSDMLPGTYQFVVRATDNGEPTATGLSVSPKVIIGAAQPEEPDEEEPDDGVVLQDPQVTNISPSNNSQVRNLHALVTATLIAGTEAKIDKESIKLVLDDKDLTEDLKVNEISESEMTITYTPEDEYRTGLHKATVSFSDSNGDKAEKSWVFTVVASEDEEEDTYNILGFEIPKRTAWILGGGIGILILALIVPWLLYLAWRGSGDSYEEVYTKTKPVLPDTSPEPDYPTFTQDLTPPPPPPAPEPEPPVQASAPAPMIDTSINPVTPEQPEIDTTASQLNDLADQLTSQSNTGESTPTAPSPQPPEPPKAA